LTQTAPSRLRQAVEQTVPSAAAEA
jgi:hypothetical protein